MKNVGKFFAFVCMSFAVSHNVLLIALPSISDISINKDTITGFVVEHGDVVTDWAKGGLDPKILALLEQRMQEHLAEVVAASVTVKNIPLTREQFEKELQERAGDLSFNTQAMQERDRCHTRVAISRALFKALSKDALNKVRGPVKKALDQAVSNYEFNKTYHITDDPYAAYSQIDLVEAALDSWFDSVEMARQKLINGFLKVSGVAQAVQDYNNATAQEKEEKLAVIMHLLDVYTTENMETVFSEYFKTVEGQIVESDPDKIARLQATQRVADDIFTVLDARCDYSTSSGVE